MIRDSIKYTANYGLPLYSPGSLANLIALNKGFENIDSAISDAMNTANDALQSTSDQLDRIVALQGSIRNISENVARNGDNIAENSRDISKLEEYTTGIASQLQLIAGSITDIEAGVDKIQMVVDEMKWRELPTISLIPSTWVDATISAVYLPGNSIRMHITSSAVVIEAGKSNLAMIDIPGEMAYGNTVVSVSGLTLGVVRAEENGVVTIEIAEEYSGVLDMYINLNLKEGGTV